MQYVYKQSESGQVGIIILMMTAVILTVAISLSQRTLQEQDIAITQDESTRVFNAAESGLEEAMFDVSQGRTGTGELSFEDLNIGVDYEIESADTFNMNLTNGQTATIPLNQSNTDLTVRWWDHEDDCNSTNPPAAMLVSIFTENNVQNFGYDPCSSNRENNFGSISQLATTEENCYYRADIPVTTDDILVRVRPLYNNSKFNISSNAIDVAQYNILSSAVNNPEDIARTISVQRSEDGPPFFMDFALVSGGSLVKN